MRGAGALQHFYLLNFLPFFFKEITVYCKIIQNKRQNKVILSFGGMKK
jgi:hypothetical protein